MIEPNDFKKGLAINFKNDPCIILEYEFCKPGKGGAFTRTKLRNLRTGASVSNTFQSGEKIEDINVSYYPVTFLYSDETDYYFMNEKFEQFQIKKETIAEKNKYLTEEKKVDGIFIEGTLFDIRLPKKMKFKVTEAPEGARGDTANNPLKAVKIETNAEIMAPLFIKQGESIEINTETGEYTSRG